MKSAFVCKLERSLRALGFGSKSDPECGCGGCGIPETSCPPRCVGQIAWKIGRGAVPQATIRVRNTGVSARSFAFSATPLSGLGGGGAQLRVEPASAVLQPGESAIVRVELEDSLSLTACQDYRAEVLVEGSWQQCVEVFIQLERDPFEKASVEQGDSLKDRAFHARVCKSAVQWKIDRGVLAEAAVTLRNGGKAVQSFGLESTALVGPAAPGARVVVSPDSLQLGAGQSGVVRLALQGSAALHPGHTYTAELLIHGFYEQCVEIRAHVEPDASGHVELEQGEAPTRIRAHHWYDHFQCTDSCVQK